MALLALSVPAGAAIAFSDDSNPATITTQTRNNNGGGTPPPTEMPNNMNGMDGNDMMGGMPMPMPPADTMAPTVTSIVGTLGTGANKNQITWVVTFSEAVTNIQAAHFVLSPAGGMFGTVPAASSGESNTISFTTTHDENSDGMVTLMFDADGGTGMVQDLAATPNSATADLTSMMAVDIDLTPPAMMIDFLTPISTSVVQATPLSSGGASSVQRLDAVGSHTGGTTRIQIGGSSGTTYTFANAQAAEDSFLLDNSKGLLITTEQGTNAGASLLFFGTNIGDANSAFTNISALTNSAMPQTTARPSGSVTYTGRYLIARLPSGTADYDSQLYQGDVNATWDFSINNQAFSGTTTPDDSTTHTAGTFLGGSLIGDGGVQAYTAAGWQGRLAGETTNTTIQFAGQFFGTGATAFTGTGATTGDNRTIISLYGETSQ